MSSEAIPEPSAVGVIETDAYCEGCGFNLHSQKVWRDERLQIAVCRCPECGRHGAAGKQITTGSLWLRRVAVGLMGFWVAFQLLWIATLFFGLAGLQGIASEGLTYGQNETIAGEPVGQSFNATTAAYEYKLSSDGITVVPNADVVWARRLAPWLRGDWSDRLDGNYASPTQVAIIAILFGVPTFLAAVGLAAFSWFWRRGMKWIWLLVPMLSTLFVWGLMEANNRSRRYGVVRGISDESIVLVVVFVFEIIVIGLGIGFGRPVARFALNVFVPPKARQHFAFLWHCDGLTMPASTSTHGTAPLTAETSAPSP